MTEKSVITVKIPSDLKKKMKRVKINWSEYIRNAVQKKLEEENKNIASTKLDEIRARSKPVATEELVTWIREYREK
ncbi:MAG: hypothetical protein ACP5JW_00510 [Candidatus Bathyarchaeia archaeon]